MAPALSPTARARAAASFWGRRLALAAAAAMVIAAAGAPLCAQGVPYIYQPLAPTSTAPGGPAFTLTVSGTGFVPGAVVRWDGQPLATTFVSASRLTAAIPAADIATAQAGTITVRNPGVPVASNFLYLPVAKPIPRMDYLNANGSPLWLGHTGNDLNQPYSIAAGDFEPGQPGLILGMNAVLSGNPGFLDLYQEGAGGGFSLQSSSTGLGPSPGSIAVGDFTGNGRLDVAVADTGDAAVRVLLNGGGGAFSRGQVFSLPGSPALVNCIASADFNHDGNLDLAVATNAGIDIFLGNGDGTFTPAPGGPVDPGPDFFGLAVGDFNGDGNLDLAATNFGGEMDVFLGGGDGTFTPAPSSPIQVNPFAGKLTGIAAADFNGDGKLDLAAVTAGIERLVVFLGNGDGTFTQVARPVPALDQLDQIFDEIDGWAVQVGDFLANGKLDVAAMEQDVQGGPPADFIYTYLGNGDGTFTPSDYSLVLPQSPTTSFTAGALVSNGLIDFASASQLQNWLNVLVPQPTPASPAPDFGLVARSGASQTVVQGGSATYGLGVTSLSGFAGPVFLTCSAGLPASSVCSWTPADDPPSANSANHAIGAGVVDALPSGGGPDLLPTLTIYTAAPGGPAPTLGRAAPRLRGGPPATAATGGLRIPPGRAIAVILLALLFSTAWWWRPGLRRSRRRAAWSIPAFCLIAALGWMSCGAGPPAQKPQPPPPPAGGTPTGVYTITVTCTAYPGSDLAFSHTMPLTLTVTPLSTSAAATGGSSSKWRRVAAAAAPLPGPWRYRRRTGGLRGSWPSPKRHPEAGPGPRRGTAASPRGRG